MEKVSDRLKKFIKFDSERKWNGSIREFERQLGWNNASVNQFTDSPKIERITELKDFVPELNITWLLTGQGEMILSTDKKTDALHQLDEIRKKSNGHHRPNREE